MSIIDPCNRTRNVHSERNKETSSTNCTILHTSIRDYRNYWPIVFSVRICKTYCQENFYVASPFIVLFGFVCRYRIDQINFVCSANCITSIRKLLSYRSIFHPIEIKRCKSSDAMLVPKTRKKYTGEYFCVFYI